MKTAYKISLLSLDLAVLSTVVFALPQRTMLCIDGECSNFAYAQWTSLVTELNNLSCGWPMQYLSSGYSESRWNPPYPWTNSCMHDVRNDKSLSSSLFGFLNRRGHKILCPYNFQ